MLLKQIKSLAQHSDIEVFSNIEIFHHTAIHNIELLLYDATRGIYLFEIKRWSFDDLKNATVEKAQQQEKSNNTLAFEKTQDIIKRKFNEILHNDGVDLFNYLLMENLSAQEYEHLDDSLKSLLPKEKIIFSDSSTSDIFKKLESAAPAREPIPTSLIMGTLLTQYTLIDDNGKLHLCNDEQREFIDIKINNSFNLTGEAQSGKSSILLLKAIRTLFKKEVKRIVLIKPTILARDIAYKKLLEIIEHGIIELDPANIEILTPLELLNKHLTKLKKPLASSLVGIDPKLLQKPYNGADIILCDDAFALPQNFIDFIQHSQKNGAALFVNPTQPTSSLQTFTLHNSYEQKSHQFHILQTNPYPKAMQLVHTLTQSDPQKTILIVSDKETYEHLQEDLETFIEPKTSNIDANLNLLEQNYNTIQLTTYDDVYELSADIVIALDISKQSLEKLRYALHRAKYESYMLYENECDNVAKIKEIYESDQN